MKNFIKNLSLFVVIPLVYLILIGGFNLFHVFSYNFKLSKVNYYIAGDSQIQNSINSNDFDNALNYAKSNEPYCVSFWKIKYLIHKQNVKFNNIILGFSHHDISALKDNVLSDNGASVQFKRNYGIHLFDIKDSVAIDYYKYYNVLLRNIGFYPHLNHHKFTGKFAGLKRNLTRRDFYVTNEIIKHNHFYLKNKEYPISKTNLKYLDSIIDICSLNNINLKLVGTPVSKTYFNSIPTKFKLKYEVLKKAYLEKGVNTCDFSESIHDDNLFSDFNHLNYKGSKLFMEKNLKLLQ